ncbi:hypothetical protein RHOSPDRAFT_30692 [Rhodotorula sp. JG-1b]|nr:hypothetical protein RHOSPDRAFT_30692 [Rhodotorula sp. JG-1b]
MAGPPPLTLPPKPTNPPNPLPPTAAAASSRSDVPAAAPLSSTRPMASRPVPLSLPNRPVTAAGGGGSRPPYTPTTSLYTPSTATPPLTIAGSPRGAAIPSYPTASTSTSTSAPPPPFLAGSPKLPPTAGTATTPTAGGTTTPSTSSAIPDSSAPASSAWSAIPPRLTPDRVAPTAQLIELGEGWSVRYRAWKAPAILVAVAAAAACQQDDAVASAESRTTMGRMDYDPWKAPLGSPSSFTTAGAAKSNRATKDKSNAPTRSTTNEAGPPPPSKKARTMTGSSSDAAKTGVAAASAKGNAFDDLLAQEMTSSAVASNATVGAVVVSEATTPSILMDAIKTPPLAANSVNAAERKPSLRVPAALRKAKAREEAAAAAAAGPDKDLVVYGSAAAPMSTSLQSSTASSTLPEASTSSSSSSGGASAKSFSELRNRLAPICNDPTFCSRDPLELALSTLRTRRTQYAQEGRDQLDLLWHVERHAVTLVGDEGEGESNPPPAPASTTDGKGKRKEVPGDASADDATSAGEECAARLRRGDGHARVLWAFSVVKGGEKDPDDDLDMGSLDQILVDFEFEGLEALAEGELSHSSLFPRLYSPGANSTTNFALPLSTSARSYPSCLALSENILIVPSATDPTPSCTPTQGAYRNFRAALSSCILDELVARPCEGRIPLRLDDAAIFLADPETVYRGMARPATFRAQVHPPTLNRTALLLFTSISDVGLEPFSPATADSPAAAAEKATRTKVILAPLGIEARVVNTYAADSFSPERLAELRREWAEPLSGAGVALDRLDAEGFVLCAITPSAVDAYGSNNEVEALWPRSLVLVDKRPPHSEPSAVDSKSVISVEAARDCSTSPALSTTRTEGIAPTGPRASSDVWAWYKEETKRREEERLEALRREQEDQEALRQKEQASITSDKAKVAGAPSAAAPINERTPMSLGTASTEAPSPAELLALPPSHTTAAAHEHELPQAVADDSTTHDHHVNGMDIDFGLNFYPSPAEAGHAVLSGAGGQSSAPLSTLDAALSSFDWGDGTFGAISSSAAGHDSIPAHASGPGYEDSLMLGLTDDDFSFFDTPSAPAVDGMAAPLGDGRAGSAAALMSVSGPPGFDAFPPPISASLPDNPFAFDVDGGFPMHHITAASMAPVTQAFAPVHIAPPLAPTQLADDVLPVAIDAKFSDGIDHTQSGSMPTVPPEVPSAGKVDFGPSFALDDSASRTGERTVAAFGPVRFDSSLAVLDDRFDPRRGKYGLPSPDSDDGGRARALVPVSRREKQRTRSWYEAVYDPRLHVADRLVSQRIVEKLPSETGGSRLTITAALQAPKSSRAWTTRRRFVEGGVGRGSIDSEALPSPDAWPQNAYASDAAVVDADGDISDEITSDEDVEAFEADDPSSATVNSDVLPREIPSAALLACGRSLVKVLSDTVTATQHITPPPKPTSYEMAYAVFAEQAVYQRQLRRLLLTGPASGNENTSTTTAASTSAVASLLSSVASALGTSPLFSDQTSLPALAAEAAPAFSIRAQSCLVQTDSLAFDFWRAMGFEPIAAAKDVTAVVLCEDEENGDFVRAAHGWMDAMRNAYEGLRLGQHRPAEVTGSPHVAAIRGGLLVVPTGRLAGHALEAELKPIYAAILDLLKHNTHVVVYVHASVEASLDSLGPLAEIIQQITKCRINPNTASANVLAVPLPSGPAHGSLDVNASALAHIAFAVYDQLQVAIERIRLPVPETFPTARPPPVAPLGPAIRLFQAPVISIALPDSQEPQFALSWPPSSFDIEYRHRFLHVCYATRPVPGCPGQEWLVISIVDEKGETWRVLPRYLKYPPNIVVDVHRARIIWNFTKGVVESADVEWRVLVCKLGEPSAVEIKAWESVLHEFASQSKRPLHLSFSCIDPEPPIALSRFDAELHRPSTTSSIPEEGEFNLRAASQPSSAASSFRMDGKGAAVFDAEPAFFSFTPAEPIPLSSLSVVAPASTFLIHLPRTTPLSHCTPSPPPTFEDSSSRQATSAYGIHLLCSTSSKSSLYDSPVASYLADVRRNFVELAALGKARWGTSGRMSWHLEAARDALLLSV